jgi:hypothetical protein
MCGIHSHRLEIRLIQAFWTEEIGVHPLCGLENFDSILRGATMFLDVI